MVMIANASGMTMTPTPISNQFLADRAVDGAGEAAIGVGGVVEAKESARDSSGVVRAWFEWAAAARRDSTGFVASSGGESTGTFVADEGASER